MGVENGTNRTAATLSPPEAMLDGAICNALGLAAYNAVTAQQQAWISRQAAVTMACAGMISLCFGATGGPAAAPAPHAADGSGDGAAAEGSAGKLVETARAAAEGLGKGDPALAGGSALDGVTGFARSLVLLDAGDQLRGATTLATLLSALALSRLVLTGDPKYGAAAEAGQRMLAEATDQYERICRSDLDGAG
jgi:hypothetical protein